MKGLRSAPQKFVNLIFNNFICPRSSIRNLLYLLSLVFILTPSLAGAAQVSLAWVESPGPNVVGYKMYYGNYGGTYQYSVKVGKSTSATISGLQIGKTYYFAVTAYDSNDNESEYSNEVSHTIKDVPSPVQDLFLPAILRFYLPFHSGFRFSRNARRPSALSSVSQRAA